MNNKWIRAFALLAVVMLFPAFHANAAAVGVFVSITPQQYFVEKIAGDRVNVHVMVAPGASPHTYEPSSGQMKKLAEAEVYFSIGVTFEKAWLDRIRAINPDMAVVETDRGIKKQPASRHHDHDHGHGGHDHGHDHGAMDPHIWLSPPLVKLQARHILEGLIRIDPDGREAYESNYAAFIAAIVELDMALRNRLEPGQAFLVYHPAWGYFADAYGLEQIPVEVDGKAPKAKQIQQVIGQAKEKGIQVVMVQPQISSRDAETIAREIDGDTVKADPLAKNWAQNLRDVAELIGKQQRP